jgi:hypothetical protein
MSTMTQVVFLAFLAGFAAVHAESVDFTITPENGKPIVLPGELEKPVGEGPFPAIVMLHGCAGPWPLRDEMWSRRMVDWGYVVLRVPAVSRRVFVNVFSRLTRAPGPKTLTLPSNIYRNSPSSMVVRLGLWACRTADGQRCWLYRTATSSIPSDRIHSKPPSPCIPGASLGCIGWMHPC